MNGRLPAMRPASTGSATPVMAEASGLARNTAAAATSAGSTIRPSG